MPASSCFGRSCLTPGACAAALVAASLWAAGPGPARAERADRNKPMVVEADREGTIDTQRGVTTFSGNALISQGTMLIRAERVEVRDPPGGARSALALPGRCAGGRRPARARRFCGRACADALVPQTCRLQALVRGRAAS